MPELPEVETTRRGLVPHMQGQRIEAVIVRNRALRWPVPRDLAKQVSGCTVRAVERRGKYLLIDCGTGWLILHLGMSGSLRVVPKETPAGKITVTRTDAAASGPVLPTVSGISSSVPGTMLVLPGIVVPTYGPILPNAIERLALANLAAKASEGPPAKANNGLGLPLGNENVESA